MRYDSVKRLRFIFINLFSDNTFYSVYKNRNLPLSLKKQKIEEPPSEIPDVLQGEIARLDQRFKVFNNF